LPFIALSATLHFMQLDAPSQGLRSLKKERTREAIEEAAIRIATEHGYAGTTAQAIADAANVSLRTMFNYFPQRDEAISGPTIALGDLDEIRRQLAEAPTVLQGTIDVFDACAPALDGSSELQRRRKALIQSTPELLHVHRSAIDRFENELIIVVEEEFAARPGRRRLGRGVTPREEARLLVTIVGGAIRFGVDDWLSDGQNDTLSRRDAMAGVIHQFALLLTDEQ
jgi:AcrR family transcriptional regulator